MATSACVAVGRHGWVQPLTSVTYIQKWFFYPVKHSGPDFWLLNTTLLESACPSKAVDSQSHIKLWGAGVCVWCCCHGSLCDISRAWQPHKQHMWGDSTYLLLGAYYLHTSPLPNCWFSPVIDVLKAGASSRQILKPLRSWWEYISLYSCLKFSVNIYCFLLLENWVREGFWGWVQVG